MNKKNNLDTFCISVMILLCALWGFQQVAIKAVIDDVSPIWQAGMRSLVAALLLGIWVVVMRQGWIRGLTILGAIAGSLFALEFALLYVALRYTDASRVALLLYTSPFVVAIGAHWFIAGERFSIWGWIGVMLAFIGTATVLQTSASNGSADNQRLFGDLLALGAGIAWGATTLVVRMSALSTASPLQTLCPTTVYR